MDKMSLIYYNLRTLGINLGENMKKLMLVISTVLLIITGIFSFNTSNNTSEIRSEDKNNIRPEEKVKSEKNKNEEKRNDKNRETIKKESDNIDQLTSEEIVLEYLKENKKLPDYYITKKEAGKSGWEAKKGNLCEVLPDRAIGGDIFTNREKSLPDKKGRIWYEADINYSCGHRNADRILFSSDGLIFVTHDHYKSFEKIN